ncbi:E3 SUMO-protein ligase ZBED1-like [Lasioglossum baleicum]|uniref:E3 SUMO-protein ligase ZBED1-like n=1 Tax=Lasioglossum baleicum TaxID=434251 RepID=UPI003FCE527A
MYSFNENEVDEVREVNIVNEVTDACMREIGNGNEAIRRSNRRRSTVWDHFAKIDDTQAKCNICKRLFKMKYGNTSGLSRHLKYVHPTTVIPSISTSTHTASTNYTTCTSEINWLTKDSLRAKQITRAIERMIVLDLHSYNIVQQKGFRELLSAAEPRYQIPCRTTFSRSVIPEMYKKRRKEVQEEIYADMHNGTTVFALTTDGWTSRAVQSYLSLTLHYTTTNFEIRRYMLNLHYLPKSHTSIYIQKTLVNLLSSWGINSMDKEIVFTTDNGRNLVKAIKLNKKWSRMPCFAHCLQLAIKCTLQKLPQYNDIRKKCRAIATYFSRSSTARQKFMETQKLLEPHQTPLQLIQEVDVRWNSTHNMMHRLLLLRAPLNMTLLEDNMPQNLNNDEWNTIEKIVNTLNPLKEATDIMSGETYPTLSQYLPMYTGLMTILQEEIEQSNMNAEICRDLCQALKERFDLIAKSDPIIIATLLNPRFKDRFLSEEMREQAIQKLKEKMNCITITDDTENQSIPSTSTTPQSKLSIYFERKLGNAGKGPGTQDTIKDREIRTYLSVEVVPSVTDIANWWKCQIQYPLLREVARNYLAIPATQCTSERLFSSAGNIVTPNRTRLLSTNIEEICFLHYNLK